LDHAEVVRRIVFAVCLLTLLLSCAAEAPKHAPSIVTIAEQRWYRAICRWPRYDAIKIVPAPLVCNSIEDAAGCHGHGLIRIADDLAPEVVPTVLLHEMGHSLAPYADPAHLPAHKGVMSASIASGTKYITAHDIAWVCKEYDCPCNNPEIPTNVDSSPRTSH
jgi:hypothetical protein